MVIGLLKIEISIHDSHSLKEKRSVLKSLKDRLRRQFNISIAEIAYHDKWQNAHLGIAAVSSDNRHVNQQLSQVVDFIETIKQVEISHYQVEIF